MSTASAPKFAQVVQSQSHFVPDASNSGVLVGWGGQRELEVKLVVTSITGDLTVAVEHADAPGGAWSAADTFPTRTTTTTGVLRQIPGNLKPYVRVSWDVAAAADFTVSFALTPSLMLVG
jgi:hypothetical protein